MATRLRVIFGAIALAAGGAVFAQSASTLWKTISEVPKTRYTHSAFSKNNEVVVSRHLSGNTDIVGLDKHGLQRWIYNIPAATTAAILATTDDRVYVLLNQATPSVLALTQDGAFVWRSYFTTGSAARSLTEMRIFGDSLLAVGTGRTVAGGTGPRTITLSLNRHTGAQNYLREYLIGGQPYNDGAQIRSGASFAYILARKAPNIASAVLKVNPANGDVVGTYVVGSYRVADFQVDSAGSIYTVGSLNGPELRKINGAGTGSFPLVYRRPWGSGKIILSGGAAYTLDWSRIRKTRASDGVSLWEHDYYPGLGDMAFTDLKADAYGWVSALAQYWHSGQMWAVFTFEPTSGTMVNSFGVANFTGEQRAATGNSLAINSFGEILTAGYIEAIHEPDSLLRDFACAARFAQPITLADDNYTVVEGTTLTANLLANDRYTNPAYCEVYYLHGSGPAQGTLNISEAGQLVYNAPTSSGPQTFKYLVTRDRDALTANVNINVVRGPRSFTLSQPSRVGPGNVAGTITMSSPGPATVTLASDNPLVPLPATLDIPNQTRTFSIRAIDYVTVSTPVTLSATFNGVTAQTVFTVHPAVPSAISFNPVVVTGGNQTIMTLTLSGAAGPNPVVFNLSTTSPYASVPATAVIPVGATKVQVPITTTTPPSTRQAFVTCVSPVGTLTSYFRINP